MEHTEGKLEVKAGSTKIRIYPPDNGLGDACGVPKYICEMATWNLADAKRLVKCWNGYIDLVDAMKDALDKISEWTAEACSDAEKVLAKAIAEAEKQ